MNVEAHLDEVMQALAVHPDVLDALRVAYANPSDMAAVKRAARLLNTVPVVFSLFTLITPAEALRLSALVKAEIQRMDMPKNGANHAL